MPLFENPEYQVSHLDGIHQEIVMSNFNFQWTKTVYQNNLSYIAFFFYTFQGL